MDVQVLLLMDPGAGLGWAVLSDTLPSAGGERKYTSHQQTPHIKNTDRHVLVDQFWLHPSSEYNKCLLGHIYNGENLIVLILGQILLTGYSLFRPE